MSIPQDLTADLPSPRDDEPASLRQDIIDELTDHLECATKRELLTNTTASGGRQSPVLVHFGSSGGRDSMSPAEDSFHLWHQHAE